LCMGLVVITSNDMYGMHLDTPQTTQDSIGALKQCMDSHGGKASAIYGSCNRAVRYKDGSGGNQKWIAEMQEIAALLGYKGKVYGFDTSIAAPIDGTFVEYQEEPTRSRCQIFYKRNEEMAYTRAKTPMNNVFQYRPGGGVKLVAFPTSGATPTGNLNE